MKTQIINILVGFGLGVLLSIHQPKFEHPLNIPYETVIELRVQSFNTPTNAQQLFVQAYNYGYTSGVIDGMCEEEHFVRATNKLPFNSHLYEVLSMRNATNKLTIRAE